MAKEEEVNGLSARSVLGDNEVGSRLNLIKPLIPAKAVIQYALKSFSILTFLGMTRTKIP